MRRVVPVLILGVLVAIGCQQSSPKGGMPTENKTTFTIQVPATAVSVKQGDQDEVKIAIRRGSDFTNDVKVDLDVPPGVTVTPKSFTFMQGNNDQKVTLQAAADATVGTHTVKVMASPTAGQPTSVQFDVNVKTKS